MADLEAHISELAGSVQELSVQQATYAERVNNLVKRVDQIRDDLVWTRRFVMATLVAVVVDVFVSLNGNGG